MVNRSDWSVIVFAGEPLILPVDVRRISVTIDCGKLIDQVVNTTGIANPTVTWYKHGFVLTTGSAINVVILDEGRFCIITGTLWGLHDSGGNYSCEVCSTTTYCKRIDTCFGVCGK